MRQFDLIITQQIQGPCIQNFLGMLYVLNIQSRSKNKAIASPKGQKKERVEVGLKYKEPKTSL